MGFIKCPRCELNYIREEEQYCPVCKREMKGESHDDPFELCSICNENPVMPGKDVCYACYKEMTQQQGSRRDDEMEESDTSEVSLGMEDVSEMDEIELGGMPEDMPEEIGEQISLEEEKSKEAEDDDEDEDDEDDDSTMYEVTCPNCGQISTLDEETLMDPEGDLVCPHCGATFDIELEGTEDDSAEETDKQDH